MNWRSFNKCIVKRHNRQNLQPMYIFAQKSKGEKSTLFSALYLSFCFSAHCILGLDKFPIKMQCANEYLKKDPIHIN